MEKMNTGIIITLIICATLVILSMKGGKE